MDRVSSFLVTHYSLPHTMAQQRDQWVLKHERDDSPLATARPASRQHVKSHPGADPHFEIQHRTARLDEKLPLVSCIMPTFNRRRFVPRAILYFLRQDYPNKELILVDDGTDRIGDLIPCDPRLRYIQIPQRASIGAKRNLACVQAAGQLIAHWDDDDWHAPRRLRYQVNWIMGAKGDLCGINILLFFDIRFGRAWRYTYPEGQPAWLSGSSLVYTRDFWGGHPFPEIDVGEDSRFVWCADKERIVVLPDPTFHVGIIHEENVSPKHIDGARWQPHPVQEIRRLFGSDWDYYHLASDQWTPASAPVVTVVSGVQYQPAIPVKIQQAAPRSAALHELPCLIYENAKPRIDMITVARTADLTLPEYAALNYSQSQPWTRRWEIPFVLFQCRLANTMSMLDYTSVPGNFYDRLSRLYPHVLYRHHNPIQDNQFVLPIGIPDESFDRVICMGTLEHLIKWQRNALIADMARRLKVGGLLLVTSDYYFDSFWNEPAFLQAGLMRADRQEVFNGCNKITPNDWLELCRGHHLFPMAKMIEDPKETDIGLYRNQQPYPHACIAGIFSKQAKSTLSFGKKLLLALLTWNTRDASLDSLRAYIKEARMLRRLGQQSVICACDNGSTDGTAAALNTLDSQIDVPHRFILNPQNLGISIARNQIISYAIEEAADYVLFMDGDIEIVPFSSFAMLRYMENNGHWLGCVGADHACQSSFRDRTTPYMYSIEYSQIEVININTFAHYGLFRREVFDDGIKFDETAPFDRPGWGFEDNDLAFQMDVRGYMNQRISGMTYLHRYPRSSIRNMQQQGIDANFLLSQRKQYVIDKWSSVPQISSGPLVHLRNLT
jgi:glycosyltransferase involved in cell wall biosynthesis